MNFFKNLFFIIIGILAFLWIIVRLFMFYNANNVLDNQAVFEIYMDGSINNIDEYFNLPKGTYDENKHLIICKLPVSTDRIKPGFVGIRKDLSNIDCRIKYSEGSHIKYEHFELGGNSFELKIVNMHTNLNSLGTLLQQNSNIIGKVAFTYYYDTGKINRLVFSKNRIYEYCGE